MADPVITPPQRIQPSTDAAPPMPPPKKNLLAQLREALLSNGPWPIVVIILAGLLSFVAIVLWAPADTRDFFFGAHGLFFTVVAYLTASPLEK